MPTPPKGRPSKYHLKVVTIRENPYVIYSDPDPKTGQCPVQATLCRIAPLNETLGFVSFNYIYVDYFPHDLSLSNYNT